MDCAKENFPATWKQCCRVTSLIKSFDIDVKTKACLFSASDIKQVCTGSWDIVPLLACEEGYCLSHLLWRSPTCRDMNLKIEICESTPAGVYVTHMRVYSSWCVCDPYASKAAKWQEKFKENFVFRTIIFF